MDRFFLSLIKPYRGVPIAGWLNIFSALINSGASVAIIFLALYLTKQFHYSTVLIGIIVTTYGIGAMAGALIGGILCDHFTPALVCIIALFVNGLTLLVMPLLDQYYLIMFAVIVMGFSNYAFSPANRVMILSSTSGSNQQRISSLRYMMVNLGIGMYVFIGGRIVAWGYHYLFTINGLIIVFNGLLLCGYLRQQRHNSQTSPEEVPFSVPTKKSFFFFAYFGLLLMTLVFSQLRVTYPLYLHHYYHLDERLFSNIFLINTLLIVVLQMPISNYLQQFNALLTSGLGALLMGVGIGAILLGSTYQFAMMCCFAWTLGEILFFSTLQAIIYDRAHLSQKGRYMGIAQMMAAFSNIIGPVSGSWLYGFNDGEWLWLSCMACGLVALLIHIKIYYEELGQEAVVIYE